MVQPYRSPINISIESAHNEYFTNIGGTGFVGGGCYEVDSGAYAVALHIGQIPHNHATLAAT